ncbi:MAG: class I SAM-dependent methyltransferase [Methanospirillum sp.]|nr:class I SAM-dependent methyltransferase [Methanospirillum sp.]
MEFFDEVYRGAPTWDIHRAQREYVALEESGKIAGDVLDVGSGTGENALFLAGRGHVVWGIDRAPRAIAIAREREPERGCAVPFPVRDALNLHWLDRTFGTVIDSGLFHVLGDFECPPYVRSFSRVLRPGGRCFMLAFSDLEPGEFSLPRRVASGEVRESFSIGWRIDPIRPAVFESRIRPEGSLAWLSALTRV